MFIGLLFIALIPIYLIQLITQKSRIGPPTGSRAFPAQQGSKLKQ